MRIKELKKKLKETVELFRNEPEYTKAKFRTLYKITNDALLECDRLYEELRIYKEPKFYPQDQQLQDRVNSEFQTKVSKFERLNKLLNGPAECPELLRFLKWNRMTLEDAIKFIEDEKNSR